MKRKRSPAAGEGGARGKRRARPRKGGPRLIPLGVMWTAGIAGALLVTLAVVLLVIYPGRRRAGSGREVELVVPGDESPEALGQRLRTAGVLDGATLFAWYVRATGGVASVKAGAHLLTDDLSPREIMARLERSRWAAHAKVTFPEGFTRFDIARRLQTAHVCASRGFLEATTRGPLLEELGIRGDSAEGYLFPATYDLPQDSDPADVLRRMRAEFEKRYAALEQRNGSSLLDLTTSLGWGRREIVILASMIEKEAVMDDERPIVASVFLNRMRDPAFTPKLLQCDPTAGYGCLAVPAAAPSCAQYAGKITHALVADAANPYNTYKHEGLPPGPIANPGARSLEAAMAPASTRYLYFVARGEGRHTFSETYTSHAAAVKGAPH